MIITYLQDALVEDAKKEFAGYKLINQNENLADINIYPQSLPEKKTENDEKHFPFILVKLYNGEIESFEGDEIVTILFVFGIYDESENKQGHKDIINMIEKYKNHLIQERIIDNYEITEPLKWSIQQEDEEQFYFGGIETNWKVKTIKRKGDEFI